VDTAKLVLDYFKAIVVWPLVAAFTIYLFRKEIRTVLARLADALERIRKADFLGISLALSQQMVSEATPKVSESKPALELELSTSAGGYSKDYRAILIVVGIANRSDKADQVISWKLSFPSIAVELDPTAAPPSTIPPKPWWSAPNVEIQPNKFVQGTLFFRGRDALQDGLPDEPLLGRLTARTLHGKELAKDVKVYYLLTLQRNPSLDS